MPGEVGAGTSGQEAGEAEIREAARTELEGDAQQPWEGRPGLVMGPWEGASLAELGPWMKGVQSISSQLQHPG